MYCDLINHEFNETLKVIRLFMNKKGAIDTIQRAARLIANTFKIDGKVLSCGNGGSLCSAMHFSEELTGRYRKSRMGYPAISISDPSYLSCVSNDFGYENIFSRYVKSVGKKCDVLFAISSSGKSINILNAIETAYNIGMKSIFLTQDNGSENSVISKHIDVEICVPHSEYLDYIQEVHMKIIHMIILIVEKEMLVKL